ncbi:unnamed protein product [Didymodactylos carnosus]|uniref:Copper type II ascorbate-dependent monooxygenase N-terminal domain-containing protein n=1 Tax=Didymodactylos carnosus TaxID=1234261 RepID=A0A816BNX6_9BILA|nr:unnamed protein product [Didymodactylos carnosus]CAF4495177.1 unnamed protein product [Didymodactylos carnosus]
MEFQSGTNNLIFAYGLVDPDPCKLDGDITYHEGRRGSRILPLRSYANPPPEDKFARLDYVEFRFNNYLIPAADTTYYCEVQKAPTNYSTKRHAIGILIEPANRGLVHHVLLYECHPTSKFDDNNLPHGLCDTLYLELAMCTTNIATVWAVGGDEIVEFPQEAGYPIGGDFEIKYYLIQAHYSNPQIVSNHHGSTGFRFYLGEELRQHELGYLSFGTETSPFALAIPPHMDKFVVDSYCRASATQVSYELYS